jgi:DNA (cytosine-5)-methyltransferase 1
MSWFLLDNLVSLPENSDFPKMKKNSKQTVAVIDLFAGPGGLGEGFSNCRPDSPFDIQVSVEYEKNAHRTLTLRSFYRKLTAAERDKYYYPFITSPDEDTRAIRKKLMLEKCADKWEMARHETLGKPHALGNPSKWQKIKKNLPLTEDDSKPTPDELAIMERIDLIKSQSKGPLIVIGGPPCQAYSVNGRNRIRAEKNYSPENDERFFLYQEYLKVLDRANPDAFVMENVEGILSAKLANGELIFEQIKEQLVRPERTRNEQYDIYSLVSEPDVEASKSHGPIYYDDSKYVINASKHGVPQARKRVILLGIKHKYGRVTHFMNEEVAPPPTTSELLDGLPVLRSGLSKRSQNEEDTLNNWKSIWEDNRNRLITILSDTKEKDYIANRDLKNKEEKTHNSRLKQISNAFANTVRELQKLEFPTRLSSIGGGKGNDHFCSLENSTNLFSPAFVKKHSELHAWLDKDLKGAANHSTRDHMASDLLRYMFSAAWANAHSDLKSPFPKSKDYPQALSPDHKNWESGHQADRFRTIGSDMVPLTITSHLRKDGHAHIHYDTAQNRSLTVREAARIQTFPDDYYFEGARGWQYQQVGNAVPSFLAKKIANHLLEIMAEMGIV